MAQVEKNENFKELETKEQPKKEKEKSKDTSKSSLKPSNTKKSFKEKTYGFAHGVKTEAKRIHWPTKKEMIKYSIATVVFILFFALFFYILDLIFALIHSLIK